MGDKRKYSGADVREALYQDFAGKCWLTETGVELGDFAIDHRIPQNEDPEKQYEWNNLYPAHRKVNERREKKMPPGGLLDPCCPDGVEQRLIQELDSDHRPLFGAVHEGDEAANNTAAILTRLHD